MNRIYSLTISVATVLLTLRSIHTIPFSPSTTSDTQSILPSQSMSSPPHAMQNMGPPPYLPPFFGGSPAGQVPYPPPGYHGMPPGPPPPPHPGGIPPPFPFPPQGVGPDSPIQPLASFMERRNLTQDGNHQPLPPHPPFPHPALRGMGMNPMFGNAPGMPYPQAHRRPSPDQQKAEILKNMTEAINKTLLANATDMETILNDPTILFKEQSGEPISEEVQKFIDTRYVKTDEEVVTGADGEVKYTKRILKPILKPLPNYLPMQQKEFPKAFVQSAFTMPTGRSDSSSSPSSQSPMQFPGPQMGSPPMMVPPQTPMGPLHPPMGNRRLPMGPPGPPMRPPGLPMGPPGPPMGPPPPHMAPSQGRPQLPPMSPPPGRPPMPPMSRYPPMPF